MALIKRTTVPWQIKAAEITGRWESHKYTAKEICERFEITESHLALLIKLYRATRRYPELLERCTIAEATRIMLRKDEEERRQRLKKELYD